MAKRTPKKYAGHRLGDDPALRAVLKKMGENIRDLRVELGLSLAELAAKVGCSFCTIHNIEHARNWPAMPVYLALCRELGVTKVPLT